MNLILKDEVFLVYLIPLRIGKDTYLEYNGMSCKLKECAKEHLGEIKYKCPAKALPGLNQNLQHLQVNLEKEKIISPLKNNHDLGIRETS